MKSKAHLIATIAFFMLITTSYYWEGRLGLLAFPTFIILIIIFIVLLILSIRQIFLLIREKFNNKKRLFLISFMIVILALVLYKPGGIIDFDKLEGNNILIAKGEGAANCITTLKLKDNGKFLERTGCFGVFDIKGKYTIKNDTIFFNEINFNRYKDAYYKFAIIRYEDYENKNDLGHFIRCRENCDSIFYGLKIIKNDLKR